MNREDKTKALGSAPVGRLFLKLALPAVLCQLVMMVNNVIDRAWVGHIGADGMLSLGAVGLSVPIQTLFLSVILMIATGMAPTLSILLGKGDRETAGKTSGACLALATILNLLTVAVLLVFADRLLLTFGASAESLPFAHGYLRTLAWGLPFSNTLLLMTMWFNAQGYVVDGVKFNILSVVLNAIFDPICIFALGMGVSGAALATNIGAIVALAFGVRKACRDGRLVRFGIRDFVPRIRHWLPSVKLGLSTLLNVALESTAMILFNASLQRYGGDRAVAAMSLFVMAGFLLMCLCMGLSMGAQPIISFNYGRKDFGRVREANRHFIVWSFACSLVFWLLFMVLPEPVWRLFTNDGELVGYAASKTRLFFAVLLLSGVQNAHLYIIKSLGLVRMSLFLGVLKRLVLLLPLIFVLPAVLPGDKATAVLTASPAVDLAAFAITALCYLHIMRNLKVKEGK